jgi:hypothetical protein
VQVAAAAQSRVLARKEGRICVFKTDVSGEGSYHRYSAYGIAGLGFGIKNYRADCSRLQCNAYSGHSQASSCGTYTAGIKSTITLLSSTTL